MRLRDYFFAVTIMGGLLIGMISFLGGVTTVYGGSADNSTLHNISKEATKKTNATAKDARETIRGEGAPDFVPSFLQGAVTTGGFILKATIQGIVLFTETIFSIPNMLAEANKSIGIPDWVTLMLTTLLFGWIVLELISIFQSFRT